MNPVEINTSAKGDGRSGIIIVATSRGYIGITVDDECDQRAGIVLNAQEAQQVVDAIGTALKKDTLRHNREPLT